MSSPDTAAMLIAATEVSLLAVTGTAAPKLPAISDWLAVAVIVSIPSATAVTSNVAVHEPFAAQATACESGDAPTMDACTTPLSTVQIPPI